MTNIQTLPLLLSLDLPARFSGNLRGINHIRIAEISFPEGVSGGDLDGNSHEIEVGEVFLEQVVAEQKDSLSFRLNVYGKVNVERGKPYRVTFVFDKAFFVGLDVEHDLTHKARLLTNVSNFINENGIGNRIYEFDRHSQVDVEYRDFLAG